MKTKTKFRYFAEFQWIPTKDGVGEVSKNIRSVAAINALITEPTLTEDTGVIYRSDRSKQATGLPYSFWQHDYKAFCRPITRAAFRRWRKTGKLD